LIEGYHAQSQMIQKYVTEIIDNWLAFPDENNVMIFEGVHLSPQYMREVERKYDGRMAVMPTVCSVWGIPGDPNPHERYLSGRQVPRLEKGSVYLSNFKYIIQIKEYFENEAKPDITVVNNLE